jgi:hypothetical protein
MSKRTIKLRKDLVIPAGTIFNCADGTITDWVDGNYQSTIATGKDSVAEIYIEEQAVIDDPETFEIWDDDSFNDMELYTYKERVMLRPVTDEEIMTPSSLFTRYGIKIDEELFSVGVPRKGDMVGMNLAAGDEEPEMFFVMQEVLHRYTKE